MQLINPSTSSNELNTTLTPHSITHGDACFAYFNKIWGIPSRRGDRHLRALLYEAAAVVLTRSSTGSTLRTGGLQLRERIGFKRAAVAVARKLAVIMHTMLKTGEFFNPNAGAAA